jgi:hypothetical protein
MECINLATLLDLRMWLLSAVVIGLVIFRKNCRESCETTDISQEIQHGCKLLLNFGNIGGCCSCL